jgi:DNA-binding MarR family transcriptional regulator
MTKITAGSTFYLALIRFLVSAKHHLIAIGADHGLSGIQVVTLLMIDDEPACPMKRLSQLFHCDASNITGIIDGLESKQLVERQNDPNDRRVKTIRLCSAGRHLRETMLERLARDDSFLFDNLSDSEAEQLIRIVQKLDPIKKPAA